MLKTSGLLAGISLAVLIGLVGTSAAADEQVIKPLKMSKAEGKCLNFENSVIISPDSILTLFD